MHERWRACAARGAAEALEGLLGINTAGCRGY